MPISSTEGAQEKIVLPLKRPSVSFSEDPSQKQGEVSDVQVRPAKRVSFAEDPSKDQGEVSDVQVRPAKRVSFAEDQKQALPPQMDPDYCPFFGKPKKFLNKGKTLKEILATAPKANMEKVNWDEIAAKWKEAAAATPSKTADSTPSSFEYPDTPFWNTCKSLADDMERRRRAENPDVSRDELINQYIEYEKSRCGQCEICLKTNDHVAVCCPYLQFYPEGAPLGPNVELVCTGLEGSNVNPAGKRRHVIRRSCLLCAALDHWCTDCPLAS